MAQYLRGGRRAPAFWPREAALGLTAELKAAKSVLSDNHPARQQHAWFSTDVRTARAGLRGELDPAASETLITFPARPRRAPTAQYQRRNAPLTWSMAIE